MNSSMGGKRLLSKTTPFGIGFIAITTLILAGCGGGGSESSPSPPAARTLSGVAAVGYPIMGGNIHTSCATGSALATTTSSTGGWHVTLSDQTLPCAVQVSGGTVNDSVNTTFYHAIATALGTVNVTPLTDLMVANVARTATPSLWFAGLNSALLTAITPTQVDAALANVRIALGLTPLNTIDPITTAFTPTPGDISDDMLTALSGAMTSTGVTYTTLLGKASTSTFVAPTGLSAALVTAYSDTTSGGGTTLPAVPTGVTATAISPTQIDVNWTRVSGATSYNVYRSTLANVQIIAVNKITTVTASPYSSTGLTAATPYYYKVTAVNALGETVGSTEISATTSAEGVTPPATVRITLELNAPATNYPGTVWMHVGNEATTRAAINWMENGDPKCSPAGPGNYSCVYKVPRGQTVTLVADDQQAEIGVGSVSYVSHQNVDPRGIRSQFDGFSSGPCTLPERGVCVFTASADETTITVENKPLVWTRVNFIGEVNWRFTVTDRPTLHTIVHGGSPPREADQKVILTPGTPGVSRCSKKVEAVHCFNIVASSESYITFEALPPGGSTPLGAIGPLEFVSYDNTCGGDPNCTLFSRGVDQIVTMKWEYYYCSNAASSGVSDGSGWKYPPGYISGCTVVRP